MSPPSPNIPMVAGSGIPPLYREKTRSNASLLSSARTVDGIEIITQRGDISQGARPGQTGERGPKRPDR